MNNINPIQVRLSVMQLAVSAYNQELAAGVKKSVKGHPGASWRNTYKSMLAEIEKGFDFEPVDANSEVNLSHAE